MAESSQSKRVVWSGQAREDLAQNYDHTAYH